MCQASILIEPFRMLWVHIAGGSGLVWKSGRVSPRSTSCTAASCSFSLSVRCAQSGNGRFWNITPTEMETSTGETAGRPSGRSTPGRWPRPSCPEDWQTKRDPRNVTQLLFWISSTPVITLWLIEEKSQRWLSVVTRSCTLQRWKYLLYGYEIFRWRSKIF